MAPLVLDREKILSSFSQSTFLRAPFHGPSRISKEEVSFVVWAPNAKRLELELEYAANEKVVLKMKPLERGYHEITCNAMEGTRYSLIVNGKRRPDPASRYQPEGVHGQSSVIFQDSFKWHDRLWKGIPKADLVIYELHVGTFSKRGTFEAIIRHLPYLRELGVTAIEIMPVAQFPGKRNWGYDGVDLYAPQNSYGGPAGLKKLIDGCHLEGLSVILDVVYNHLGPEGNYLREFGPYFSNKYTTPWGPAINFDGPGSDEVRKFYLQNARYWIEEFHADGLRLDAADKIFDFSPRNILLEIEKTVHTSAKAQGKQVHVVAESDLNDPKLLRPPATGGYFLDAQWSDDFHHSVHSFLTGESFAYYADFGSLEDVARALTSSYVYDGQYSNFRKRSHGAPTSGLDGDKFVHYIQDHDMVGNHPRGLRLSRILTFEKLKVAIALMILSQSLPMLFMGEEYAETAPFFYFVDHSEKKLIRAVREGRKRDHDYFHEVPDPQASSTFSRSKLDHSLRTKGIHRQILKYYRDLLRLRKTCQPLQNLGRKDQEIELLNNEKTIVMHRKSGSETVQCIFVLGDVPITIENRLTKDGSRRIFDSTLYSEKPGVPTSRRAPFEESAELQPFSATVFSK